VLFPATFLQSLEGLPGFDRAAFERAHSEQQGITSLRLNPARIQPVSDPAMLQALWEGYPLYPESQVPWCATGWYLSERPSFTFDPLFHAGCYYVQEASSMFLEQAFRQLLGSSGRLKVLDLSAAPGGKSTHIQSLISPQSLLVSNEVIRNRSLILKDNIIKWGASNVVVTQNDPSAFGRLPGFFDVIVVDAPCSGSGMFRKDHDAMAEWSPAHVSLCSGRQQRILADVLPALREGGLLVYSTCSYSAEEDEDIGDWLVREWGLSPRPLTLEPSWNIMESFSRKHGAPGYRFYPDKVRGEGFYLSCFTKQDAPGATRYRSGRIEKAPATEKIALQPWVKGGDVEIIRDDDGLYALPTSLVEDLQVFQGALHIVYKGTALGSVMKGKLVPDHALALGLLRSEAVPSLALAYEEAIRYLQRGELTVQPEARGWQVVTYGQQALGWINALPNRINNYYPKELRILKQSPGRG